MTIMSTTVIIGYNATIIIYKITIIIIIILMVMKQK